MEPLDLTKEAPLDFSNVELCREAADAVARAVDKAIEAEDTEGYRSHLGASVVGNECERYLFYHFRWMHRERYDGRMLRLFNVGHGFEKRVRHWLTKIGFIFIDGLDETQTQLRFSEIAGHFGGSVDGVFIAPTWGITEPTLLECKTSGTGTAFNNLDVKPLKEVKEQHYIQDCVYGRFMNIKNCLYICENKNDSDWKFVFLPLDHQVGELHKRKAEFIILDAKEPPKKPYSKRNFYLCNMCKMQPICWDGMPTDVNCRSCRNARPIENAQWHCDKWNAVIPKDAILAACSEHEPIQR